VEQKAGVSFGSARKLFKEALLLCLERLLRRLLYPNQETGNAARRLWRMGGRKQSKKKPKRANMRSRSMSGTKRRRTPTVRASRKTSGPPCKAPPFSCSGLSDQPETSLIR